jgi:hypothetical protein
LSGGVATESVATESVATGLVALSGVATGGVAGGRVMGASVAAALVASGVVASAGVAVNGVAVNGVAWGCGEGACRPETCVATGVRPAGSASEGSDGAVFVVVADGAVPRMGAPAEPRLPMSAVTPTSTRVERPAGVGGAAFAGAVVAVTCPPGVAAPPSAALLVGPNNPPGVAAVMTLRSAREVRFGSTVVRVASATLRGPASEAELVPIGAREAEAPFDSVVGAVVTASAAFA